MVPLVFPYPFLVSFLAAAANVDELCVLPAYFEWLEMGEKIICLEKSRKLAWRNGEMRLSRSGN